MPPRPLAARRRDRAPLPAERPLALVGFMGSGKSTIGPVLARHLGLPFVDLDAAVAAAAGRSVAEVFAREGEASFRAREAEALRAALAAPRSVIACGGGVLVSARCRRDLATRACCIWLDAPLGACLARIAGSGRPLLRGGPAAVRALYASRRPLYREASLRVRSDIGSPERVAERILGRLGLAAATR